jgi:hypothetical protein
MLKKNTLAILVTDTYGEPFETLRKEIGPVLSARAKEFNIDVYFIKGQKPTRIESFVEQYSNRFRYSQFWPLQFILDSLLLYKYNFVKQKFVRHDYEIVSEIPEGLRTLGVKVMLGLGILSEHYDFVLKTTSSSMFNFDKLSDEVNKIRNMDCEKVYAGSIISFNRHRKFVSGANLLLSKSSIELLQAKKMKWIHGNLDDVEIGRIMHKHKIEPISLSTINIASLKELDRIFDSQLRETQHFRCKGESFPRMDKEIILGLLGRLDSLRGEIK